MIPGLQNTQQLHKRPETKSIPALQQHGQENQDQSPTEEVSLSKEVSEDLTGASQQDSHPGLEAMLANLMAPQQPKQLEATEKVNEVGKSVEVGKVQDPVKKPQVGEPREHEKNSTEKTKDPKAVARLGNLNVSSRKESQGAKAKPQPLPNNERSTSHSQIGSKGAPKTDAPRPVGQTEQMKSSKPDGRVGLRQTPQMGRAGQHDDVDLSQETRQQLAAQRQPAYA